MILKGEFALPRYQQVKQASRVKFELVTHFVLCYTEQGGTPLLVSVICSTPSLVGCVYDPCCGRHSNPHKCSCNLAGGNSKI